MMELLNRENVKAAFEQIIAKYGADHKYAKQDRGDENLGCYYTLPEKSEDTYVPACIIGQIINIVMPETLQTLGALEAATCASTTVDSLLYGFWTGFSDEDGNVPDDSFSIAADDGADEKFALALSRAQAVQDNGGTWGESYAAYNEMLARGTARAPRSES